MELSQVGDEGLTLKLAPEDLTEDLATKVGRFLDISELIRRNRGVIDAAKIQLCKDEGTLATLGEWFNTHYSESVIVIPQGAIVVPKLGRPYASELVIPR